MKCFLLCPALIQQPEPCGGRDMVTIRSGYAGEIQGEIGENMVELIAANRGDAVGGNHMMDVVIENHKRSIEGSPAEVVYQHRLFFGFSLPLAMSELDACSTWLVQDAQDIETGCAECIHSEKSLIA